MKKGRSDRNQRPPVLAVSHERFEVGLEGVVVEFSESLGVAEVRVHGVGLSVVLMQNAEVQVRWPPVLVGTLFGRGGGHSAVHDGALCIAVVVVHGFRIFW